ncbi:MAG: enoyl-CoA hydratase/isomerase family protein [Saprospiraceae bacterium]|nr:enoyl-CoA hydratase/isomerase family protein [Saprospiraceae bacterium]
MHEGVATIEFYHPSHNSLPSQLLQSLVQAIQHADADENVKIIVLKSAGEKTFCAGASFDELVAIENFPEGKNFFMGFANVINACRKCSKIILGRIQGKAVGGGVGLAAATDYCMATKYASVKLSELAVGIGPFVVGPAIERKMGLSAMSKLALNATEWQTADWAKEKGLFHEVFENTNQLDEYIAYFVKILLNSSTLALGELKKIFWQGTEHWDQLLEERAGISGNLILTDHAKNAIHQFKNKA